MKSYCLKCKIVTENVSPRVSNTSNGKTILYQNVQNVKVKSKKQKDN